MSGTSLDGVDGVSVYFPEHAGDSLQLLASAHCVFDANLKAEAMALQQSGDNEIHRESLLAQKLAKIYAECVGALVAQQPNVHVQAIGVHGQTIRHRPELGYTRQVNHPALLAELCDIDVIADFRSRDIAAGGQGAPLVPAFHRAMFGCKGECRVVVNIGGISNISILHADGRTTGFDTGPGNVLMDAWIQRHHAKEYDAGGSWAQQGRIHKGLLEQLCDEPFLHQLPPKSTGRDLFHMDWLEQKLALFPHIPAVDVQATLCAFTATTIVDAIIQFSVNTQGVYICGGGAFNEQLLLLISEALPSIKVTCTDCLGIAPNHVEALAFAWLAQQFVLRNSSNLPDVTGAKGLRVLGALYPA